MQRCCWEESSYIQVFCGFPFEKVAGWMKQFIKNGVSPLAVQSQVTFWTPHCEEEEKKCYKYQIKSFGIQSPSIKTKNNFYRCLNFPKFWQNIRNQDKLCLEIKRMHWSEQTLCCPYCQNFTQKLRTICFSGTGPTSPISLPVNFNYNYYIPEIWKYLGVLIKAPKSSLNIFSNFCLGKWASQVILAFSFPTSSNLTDNLKADWKKGLSCIVMSGARYMKSLMPFGGWLASLWSRCWDFSHLHL